MDSAYKVALVGFAQHESATFESFFRLAARRAPAYVVQDEVMDAEVLIVNADNAQALHLVRYAELDGKVLLVGLTDGGTGWPLQRKPVKLVSVLTAMDELMGVRRSAAAPRATAAAPAWPVAALQNTDRKFSAPGPRDSHKPALLTVAKSARRSPDTEFAVTRPMVRRLALAQVAAATAHEPAAASRHASAVAARMARPGVMGMTDFGGLEDMPSPAHSGPASRFSRSRHARSVSQRGAAPVPQVRRGDVLLVAESLVEGRILHKRFRKYELSIDWSREAKQALAMIKAHPYRLVLIDRLNGQPDAYDVCRAAKQRKLANGQGSVVIMFAPTAGSMDRIKAGLAGSNAYLSRSVGDAELYKVLAQNRLVNLGGFQQTNVGF